MKKIVFSNWHTMRFFRIAVALFCFYSAYEQHQLIFVAFGIFFLFQALFNLGCSSNGCSINTKRKNHE